MVCGYRRSDPPRPVGHPSSEGIFRREWGLQWDRSQPLTIAAMAQLSIAKHPQKIHYFEEPLHPSNLILKLIKMVLIQGGTFDMGSPDTEIDRSTSESPQHQVTVPSFFMSEFVIVQGYWSVIADTMPQVGISLKRSPSTLPLKGEDWTVHPVTDVNWFEAVEFCKRLSKHSGRTYRLPTEAEWEYACRAGSKQPFHFGETITTDLANYDGTDDPNGKWSGAYDRGTNGIYREQTTPVDAFPPNAFGLYDMHGNVWEWCLDHWHDNYQGAPMDGSAWLSNDQNANRVLRGGSWINNPRNCRFATRNVRFPDDRNGNIGFRVVCEIPRTL
jgi:formylglycine-generating enzyme required for sulfatase activity